MNVLSTSSAFDVMMDVPSGDLFPVSNKQLNSQATTNHNALLNIPDSASLGSIDSEDGVSWSEASFASLSDRLELLVPL